MVGRALYQGAWTDGERHAPARNPDLPEPTSRRSAEHYQLEYAAALLQRFDPTEFEKYSALFGRDGRYIVGHTDDYEDGISQNDLPARFWDRAGELQTSADLMLRDNHSRWQDVQRAMLDYFRRRVLRTYIRPQRAGSFKELDTDIWNIENLWWRFEVCCVDPELPYDQPTGISPDFQYIFVDREELAAVAAGASSNLVTSERYEAFSPYLKLAVQAAIDQQANPGKLKTRKQVEASVRERWNVDVQASERAISAIATVVRAPDTREPEQRGFHDGGARRSSDAKRNASPAQVGPKI